MKQRLARKWSVPVTLLSAILAAASDPISAQTSATAAAEPNPNVVQMGAFDVSDVPVDQLILPTARPFTSVFGMDDNIMDVPRNVTIVSQQQM
jgi:catecholate siderophore receptor